MHHFIFTLFFVLITFTTDSFAIEGITLDPTIAVRGEKLTITYTGDLKKSSLLTIHWGIDSYRTGANDTPMQKQSDGVWKITLDVPEQTQSSIDFTFYNQNAQWDNNFRHNYHAYVVDSSERQTFQFKLGASYSEEKTTFSLWSPDSKNVIVNLDGTDYQLQRVPDFDGYQDIYSVTVPGNHKLKRYQFKVNGLPVRDPYGTMVIPGTNTNIVMDMKSIQPVGGSVASPPLKQRVDAVIYEMHIRDFTMDQESGVSPEKRGKYLGVIDSVKSPIGIKTGIAHLKELGVTHVQILPFYDFSSGMYNWGYDPTNYNIPEEQYSLNPMNFEERVREVKTMINELHKNGIRVIMDVVYNHTSTRDVFGNITDRYYDGGNLSGVGPSIAGGHPMVNRYIRDSLEYWITEYGVDGFRFDLIGVFYTSVVRNWGEYLNTKYPEKNIILYGEPWNGFQFDPKESEKVRLGNAASLADAHVGVFNAKFRETIKGGNDDASRGFMFAGVANQDLISGVRGAIRYTKGKQDLPNLWDPMFAYSPEQSINYISAHDNYCLWDKIKHSGEDNNYGRRIAKFGMGIVLTSQGIPFIHAGDEFLRSKVYKGDWTYAHNTYNAPDEFNMIRWSDKKDNYSHFAYHRDLIALRKAHAGLRLTTWDQVNSLVRTWSNWKTVVSEIDGEKAGDVSKKLIVVQNAGPNFNLNLPSGRWTKIFDIDGAQNISGLSGTVSCEGTSVCVYSLE